MIKDSINLYQSYQYLNIKCYSCGSRDHIALKCPKVHFHFNKPKIIVKYLIQEKRFREFYQRRTRKEFKTLRDLEVIQEAATQHQMIQQNELYFDRTKGKEDQTEVRSYSSIDDVMDRNIYDNPPLIYAIDSTHLKTYDFHDIDEHPAKTGHTTPSKKHTKKFQQNKLGEIEAFVSTSYDKYYNNLNIDRVKNFEVYNPNNNIIKIIVDLEKIRLQKIVEMRLGAGGHVVSRLLIKGFRMAERRKQNDVSQSSVGSIRSADAHPEKKVSPVAEQDRRQSLSVNPSDIALYNTGSRKMFAKANDSPTLTSNYTSSEALYSHLKVPNKTKEGILNLALNNSPKDRKRGLSADCSPIHEEKSSLEDHLISTSRRHKETPFNVHSFRRPSISSQGSEPSIRENSQLKINSFINSSRSALSQNQLSNTKDQKLRTAQFGEEEKSHSHRKYNNSYNSFLPSEILKSKHRLSYPVNIYQPDMGRKSILFTDARTNMTENNEGIDNKKPIALFDFTQFVKKMTGKLEENTKSPLSKSISGLSKQTSISSRITPLFPKDKVLKKDQKPLIIEILHQNNKRLGKRKKGRSNSQGKGEEMNNLITKYGLEELISPK